MSTLPVVVIGAGQAGLAVSRRLQVLGIDHVVLERGRVAETWRTQRWDSFQLNTPNRINALPGSAFPGDPAGFATAADLVAYFEEYAKTLRLPVREGVTVTAVAPASDGFVVRTDDPDLAEIDARAVVLASGGQNHPRIPALAARLPGHIVQIHAGDYRNPAARPPGAVLVVGSAQSGCQITEDLEAAGRQVHLSVSRVARAPRRYRGRDILELFADVGFFGQRPGDLPDPAMQFAAQPQVSGVGPRGHTVSLQSLAGKGVILVGRLVAIDGDTLRFDDSVADAIRFADAGSAQIKQMIDEHLASLGISAPLEPDAADVACADPEALAGPESIPIAALAAVVWTTGFGGDFSWVHLPITGGDGRVMHTEGVTAVPGVFVLGTPWLRTRASGIIVGVGDDAAVVAQAVAKHLAG
ncbi:MAG: NAD(P)-binding domain-containing protein [Acidimicrobiia bacterium]|nr:NAD(P)-binding domain-containing protein [Acidimicrobiia bacterium]